MLLSPQYTYFPQNKNKDTVNKLYLQYHYFNISLFQGHFFMSNICILLSKPESNDGDKYPFFKNDNPCPVKLSPTAYHIYESMKIIRRLKRWMIIS